MYIMQDWLPGRLEGQRSTVMWQSPALLSPLRFAAPHLEERFSRFAFHNHVILARTYHSLTLIFGIATIAAVLADDVSQTVQVSFTSLMVMYLSVSASSLWFMHAHHRAYAQHWLLITLATRIFLNVLLNEMRSQWIPASWYSHGGIVLGAGGISLLSLSYAHVFHMHGMPLPLPVHIPLQMLVMMYTSARTPEFCAKNSWLESHTSSKFGMLVGLYRRVDMFMPGVKGGPTCPAVLCYCMLSASYLGNLVLYASEVYHRRFFLTESRPMLWGPLQWPFGNSRFTRWCLLEWPIIALVATGAMWILHIAVIFPLIAGWNP
jgi:hypothetical protein